MVTQVVDSRDPALGFFHRWIIEFARRFDTVTVIALRKGEMHLPANVRVLSLGKEEGVSRLEYVRRFYSYIWRSRNDYDQVFVHMNPEYVVLAGLVWRILNKKIVLWYLHRSVTLKLKVATLFADLIATGSKESFRLPSHKVRVLGHGIDIDAFVPAIKDSSKPFSVITVGRISPSKDYETLLKAAALVPNANIQIVGAPATLGDREYESRLKNTVKELGIENRVAFAGPVKHDDIPALIASSDVFVNMSNTGSLDKAVLEAMACGTPALTSNEAFKEMLGSFDLTFPSGDHKALAEKLQGLYEKRSALSSLGERLRDIVVRQHNLPRLIGEVKRLYEI